MIAPDFPTIHDVSNLKPRHVEQGREELVQLTHSILSDRPISATFRVDELAWDDLVEKTQRWSGGGMPDKIIFIKGEGSGGLYETIVLDGVFTCLGQIVHLVGYGSHTAVNHLVKNAIHSEKFFNLRWQIAQRQREKAFWPQFPTENDDSLVFAYQEGGDIRTVPYPLNVLQEQLPNPDTKINNVVRVAESHGDKITKRDASDKAMMTENPLHEMSVPENRALFAFYKLYEKHKRNDWPLQDARKAGAPGLPVVITTVNEFLEEYWDGPGGLAGKKRYDALEALDKLATTKRTVRGKFKQADGSVMFRKIQGAILPYELVTYTVVDANYSGVIDEPQHPKTEYIIFRPGLMAMEGIGDRYARMPADKYGRLSGYFPRQIPLAIDRLTYYIAGYKPDRTDGSLIQDYGKVIRWLGLEKRNRKNPKAVRNELNNHLQTLCFTGMVFDFTVFKDKVYIMPNPHLMFHPGNNKLPPPEVFDTLPESLNTSLQGEGLG